MKIDGKEHFEAAAEDAAGFQSETMRRCRYLVEKWAPFYMRVGGGSCSARETPRKPVRRPPWFWAKCRRLYSSGMPLLDVAKKVGVPHSTIYVVLRRQGVVFRGNRRAVA
jgi:hypothetical protein